MGAGATDEKNNAKLITELAGVAEDKRGAGYIAALRCRILPQQFVLPVKARAAAESSAKQTVPVVLDMIRIF